MVIKKDVNNIKEAGKVEHLCLSRDQTCVCIEIEYTQKNKFRRDAIKNQWVGGWTKSGFKDC